jgi:hypothetical protein
VPNVFDSMLRYQAREPAMHFETPFNACSTKNPNYQL